MATKAELEAELATLKATHEKLKADVVRVAKDKAEAHGWCSVVQEALQELGLSGPEIQVTLTITDPDLLLQIASEKAGYSLDPLVYEGRVDKYAVDSAILYAVEGDTYDGVLSVDQDSVRAVSHA